MSTVVILQSNYIPWKGYFDMMHDADTFIMHDDLQYTHSDWRNRNKIITARGPEWLSIPAGRDERRLICDVEIPDQSWKPKHRRVIEQHYRRAACFAENVDLLDFLYDNDETNLSRYNQRALEFIADRLGLRTEFRDSREFDAPGKRSVKLVELVKAVGGTRYLSGPSARNYLDEQAFTDEGLEVEWKEYPDYPAYEQFHDPCIHAVSIIDLLMHVGHRAPEFIWDAP